MTDHSGAPRARGEGTTLIELLLAVFLFVLLVGGLTASFLTFVRSGRSGLAQATLVGDVQRFLELLEREVRTGYGDTFRCAASDDDGVGLTCTGSSFFFTNQNRDQVSYALSSGRILHTLGIEVGAPVTSDALEVMDLEFSVLQSTVDTAGPRIVTGQQGRVTVRVRACPRGISDERCFAVQTTLTSRQYAPQALTE